MKRDLWDRRDRIPLSRLESWHIEANEKMAMLDLSVRAQQGGETIKVELPRGEEHHVTALMRQQAHHLASITK